MAGCVKMMGTVHAYARALSGKQGRISCDPSRSRGKAPVLNPMSEARTLQSRVGTSLSQYHAGSGKERLSDTLSSRVRARY